MILIKTKTGSNLYGTNLDISKEDSILVYVFPWKKKERISQDIMINESARLVSYELSAFIKELLRGNLACHLVLWTSDKEHTVWDNSIRLLQAIKRDLINKHIILKWMDEAKFYYEKSKSLAELTQKNLNATDFMTYTRCMHGQQVERVVMSDMMSVGMVLYSHHKFYDAKKLSLLKTPIENTYDLYEYFNGYAPEYITGLVDENDDVLLSDLVVEKKSPVSFIGTVYYDEKKHERYKSLKSLLNKAQIQHNYSTKYAYLALRNLAIIEDFLCTYNIRMPIIEADFIKRIRKGEIIKSHWENVFQMKWDKVTAMISKCDEAYNEPIDENKLYGIIKSIRDTAEKREEGK